MSTLGNGLTRPPVLRLHVRLQLLARNQHVRLQLLAHSCRSAASILVGASIPAAVSLSRSLTNPLRHRRMRLQPAASSLLFILQGI